MSTWDGNNYYYSGQGVVLLGDRDGSGKPLNLLSVGNVSALSITIATTVLEHKESQTGQRAIDLRLTTETKCNLSMTMENFIAENLAASLRGTSTKNVAATAFTETINVGTVVGSVTPLRHAMVSNFSMVGKTLHTDYELNADAGSVKWLVAGSGTVAATYDYATQYTVDSLTQGFQEKYMRFEGLNTADSNKAVTVDVFKFSTDPLKELALISDAVQQFVLEGNVLADALQTSGSKFFRTVLLRAYT
jgi:hypothetical protein